MFLACCVAYVFLMLFVHLLVYVDFHVFYFYAYTCCFMCNKRITTMKSGYFEISCIVATSVVKFHEFFYLKYF